MELALRAELLDGSDDARTLIATPSTRQSGLAEYLDSWRRRVEREQFVLLVARALAGPFEVIA